MTGRARWRRGIAWTPETLRWGAWGALGAAVLLALWPPRAVVPVSAPVPRQAPLPRPIPAGSDGAADSVVRSNLFSARRQAPRVRYRDPLAPTPPEAVPAALAAEGAMGGVTGAPGDAPQLLGVAAVEGRWRALIRWAPGRPAVWCPGGARCDDGAGGGRVRLVTRDAVTVEVAGQARTLRLAPHRPVDSLPRMP
jgi:hypothetical protein